MFLASSTYRRVTVLAALTLSLSSTACTQSRFTLEGRVVDAQHRPVPAARVIVVNSAEGHIGYHNPERIDYGENARSYILDRLLSRPMSVKDGRYAARTRTDRDGRFRIAGLGADKYHVLVVHPDKGLTARGGIELPGEDAPLEIELPQPTFLTGRIHGYKKGKSGWWHGALERVHLAQFDADEDNPDLDDKGGRAVVHWSTPQFDIGDNGDFRAGPLPAGGLWRVDVDRVLFSRLSGATFLLMPVQLVEGRTNTLEVDLTQGCRLSGQVLGPDGRPLCDVGVEVISADETDDPDDAARQERRYGSLTDRKGNYTIRGIPPGKYTLFAYRNALRPWDHSINPFRGCTNLYHDVSYQQEIDISPADAEPRVVRIERLNPDPYLLATAGGGPHAGQTAPNFQLAAVDGGTVSLADLKDKPAVLLVFWATWCPPCLAEIPALAKLHAEFGDRGVAIVAVASDAKMEDVKTFVRKRTIPYTVVHDAEEDAVARAYGVQSIPSTVLIGNSGTILNVWQGWRGQQGEKEIRAELTKLLSGEQAPVGKPATTAAGR